MIRRRTPLAALAGLALVAMTHAGPAMAAPRQLNFGGSTTTSAYYPYYTAVANGVSKRYDDLNLTVVSSGGFSKNVQLMQSGQMQLGGVSPDLIEEAEAKGFKKFRVLWWVNPAVQNVMVRKDSGIADVAQLDGRCMHPGMNGSSSQKNMMRILAALQIKPKLHMSDPKDAINAIRNGRCDGQVKSISGDRLDAATAELNVSTPMTPIGYTSAQVAAIRAAIPWMAFHTIPAGLVPGAPAVTTHALWVGVAATSDMDADTAYKIVRGMWEGIDEQRAAFKAISGLDILKQTVEVSTTPLHAGAVRYLRERGVAVPDRLVPPEAR